ncbi:MAG: MTH938/NDUFAF3 family protein, partial [Gammaproteobacteria bacterium]|nr:MTH938/NDUFAF3 family protein [Gammaproteobacteria bacterium]
MHVSSYEFGKLDVGDQAYTSDLIITPQRVEDSWWRKDGHQLQIEDLSLILAAEPQTLVVGTGYFGRMQIAAETKQYLQDHGITLIQEKTGEAVNLYNRLAE